jgi:hypothetical protein
VSWAEDVSVVSSAETVVVTGSELGKVEETLLKTVGVAIGPSGVWKTKCERKGPQALLVV